MTKSKMNNEDPADIITGLWVIVISVLALLLSPVLASAQNNYKLTLTEAVQFAKQQNKWVQAAGIEENAASEDRKDATEIPAILAKAFYIARTGRPGPVLIEIRLK